MSILHSRRTALLGGIGAGLMVPQRADANTVFTSFGFKATGTTTNRTMPDRLAEVHNVLDFGADPTGGNASTTTAAIQAAVDAVAGANRGIIYFPYGFYSTNASITFPYAGNLSICFLGDVGTAVSGNFSGYIFDRILPTAAVTISNASPGVFTESAPHGLSANDAFRLVPVDINAVLPTPLVAQATYYVKTVLSSTTYSASATAGGTAINTSGSPSGTFTRGPVNTTGGRVFERLTIQNGHATGGSIRLGATAGGAIRDCSLSAHICLTTEDAAGVSSSNILIQNTVFSNGSGVVSGSHFIIIGGGGVIENCTMSGANVGVRAYGSGLHVGGVRAERNNTGWLLGVDSADNNAGLFGFSLMSASSEGCWTAYDLVGLCSGFAISGCGTNGHDSGNAGQPSGVQGSQYGLRIRADCARNGVIQSCNMAGDYQAVAAFAIDNSTSRANVVLRENNGLSNNGGGVGWIFPTNAYTAEFYNNNQSPLWTFSQLPSGGNVLEGDEFDITDGNSTTWGANVTAGSSSGRVLVRWNGSNWTVVGK